MGDFFEDCGSYRCERVSLVLPVGTYLDPLRELVKFAVPEGFSLIELSNQGSPFGYVMEIIPSRVKCVLLRQGSFFLPYIRSEGYRSRTVIVRRPSTDPTALVNRESTNAGCVPRSERVYRF